MPGRLESAASSALLLVKAALAAAASKHGVNSARPRWGTQSSRTRSTIQRPSELQMEGRDGMEYKIFRDLPGFEDGSSSKRASNLVFPATHRYRIDKRRQVIRPIVDDLSSCVLGTPHFGELSLRYRQHKRAICETCHHLTPPTSSRATAITAAVSASASP